MRSPSALAYPSRLDFGLDGWLAERYPVYEALFVMDGSPEVTAVSP